VSRVEDFDLEHTAPAVYFIFLLPTRASETIITLGRNYTVAVTATLEVAPLVRKNVLLHVSFALTSN